MTGTSFFFVNRTSASSRLAGSDGVETTAIQHFVQTGRKRARKRVKLVSAFQKPSLSSLPDDGSGHKNIELKPDTVSTISENVAQPLQSDVPLRKPSNPPCYRRPADRQYHLYVFRPSIDVASSDVDPFNVTSVHISSEIRSLLHYYTTIMHPSQWPNETQALRRGAYIFEEGINRIVQDSLQDSLGMYCLLACASSRLTNIDKLTSFQCQRKVEWYMNQALSKMQQRIDELSTDSQCNSLYLLQYMLFLSAAEAFKDNPTASRIHLEAGVQLLAQQGMTVADVESQNLQGMMIMSDLYLACISLKPCLFDGDIYDPGPVCNLKLSSGEMLDLPIELQYMAQGFEGYDFLQPSTRTIVDMIREVYTTKICLDTSAMSAARALETTHWITKRGMAVRNRLLSMFPQSSSSVVTDDISTPLRVVNLGEDFDRAIRIALIQFTLLSMNITGRIKTVKMMAPSLQRHLAPLLRKDTTESGIFDELMLWLLVTGYTCAQDASAIEEWFVNQLLTAMKKSTIHPSQVQNPPSYMESLEKVLSAYFYDATFQRPRLRRLLNNVR